MASCPGTQLRRVCSLQAISCLSECSSTRNVRPDCKDRLPCRRSVQQPSRADPTNTPDCLPLVRLLSFKGWEIETRAFPGSLAAAPGHGTWF